MNIKFFILIIAGLIVSCNQDSGTDGKEGASDRKIRKKALSIAENYVSEQLTDFKKVETDEGIIIMGNDQMKYVIYPGKIYIGLIDDDNDRDAIVSIDSFQGQFQVPSGQLILTTAGGKFMLTCVIDADMKILKIENRIITAEVPTHTRNSPLFNCSECQELVNYKFIKGELVRVE